MKYLLKCFFISVFVLSCTNNSSENFSEIDNSKNLNDEVMQRSFPCGPGYHLEFQVFDELRLFKKGGCDDGFGFCFGIRVRVVFDCVRNTSIEPAISRVSYNPTTGETEAIGIEDPITKTVTFYFHKDIVNSPIHSSSDFDTFDVENGVYMNDDIELVGGSYPVSKSGDFFKYTVPYVERN